MSSNARRLLLLSNSTLHPTGYLEYAEQHICDFLKENNVKKVLFVPYALHNRDEYAAAAKKPFESWGFQFTSIHESKDPVASVKAAEAVFVGGGNTFRLLKGLYDNKVVDVIHDRVINEGMPYIGSSAGTNVATVSICTTNDMPIVFPPSFDALNLVPFNINPHYLDHDPKSTHKGETRDQRIRQYHEYPNMPPVVAMREGSILKVDGNSAKLLGSFHVRLYVVGQEPVECEPDTDFSFLLIPK